MLESKPINNASHHTQTYVVDFTFAVYGASLVTQMYSNRDSSSRKVWCGRSKASNGYSCLTDPVTLREINASRTHFGAQEGLVERSGIIKC